ncbi:MAG TPA: cupin domain-containing protein [Candidatus Baltobacteraceae bacterium]|jgi:quercetin dioxygenase-like cupin family protein
MSKANVYKWDDVEEETLKKGVRRKFIHGESAMIARFDLAKGEIVPEHSHHNEQLSYIVSGALKFVLGGKDEVIVRGGEVLVIPSNLPHSAETLEDCIAIDVFSPPRQDWIDKTDSYIREEVKAAT